MWEDDACDGRPEDVEVNAACPGRGRLPPLLDKVLAVDSASLYMTGAMIAHTCDILLMVLKLRQ